MTIRVFSYGGGVQSTAALVLAVQGMGVLCEILDESTPNQREANDWYMAALAAIGATGVN